MPMRTARPSRRHRRRGSLYLSVLFVGLIVGLMGLSALSVARMRRRGRDDVADAAAARQYAHAAVRLGLMRIEADPDWRYAYASGVWAANLPIGTGRYAIAGVDPTDNLLANDAEHPVTLTGTGTRGSAVQKVQVTLAPVNRGYGALKSTLHAGGDLTVGGVTLDCDQTVSANGAVALSGSITGDVQAVGTVSGGGVGGAVRSAAAPLSMPDPNTLFDFYLANGTRIPVGSLPLGYPNGLRNPGGESGTSPWDAPPFSACQVRQEGTPYAGANSIQARFRGSDSDGPEQDVSGLLRNGRTYDLAAWVLSKTKESSQHRAVLRVTGSDSGTRTYRTAATTLYKNSWGTVTGQFTPTWSGTLTSATLRFETVTGLLDLIYAEFWIDQVVFKEAGTDRAIAGTLLSAASNPYSGGTNARGIYVLDLAGQKLVIKNARLAATLVLLNPGAGTTVGGNDAVNWKPAVAGLPALLVRGGDVAFDVADSGLSEYWNVANFNPAGTPYDGFGQDADQSDTYPAKLDGLIYGAGSLTFRTQPALYGTVVAAGDVTVAGPMTLRRDPAYYRGPPPGFNGPEVVRLLLDSARKPLD